MLQAIRISPTYANNFGAQLVNVGIDINRPPMDVAFDVLLKQGEAEWQIGTIALRKGELATFGLMKDMPPDFVPDTENLVVVLRPSVQAAEQQVHISEFWDGEIVLRVKGSGGS
jgi:hypothetical protein